MQVNTQNKKRYIQTNGLIFSTDVMPHEWQIRYKLAWKNKDHAEILKLLKEFEAKCGIEIGE